VVATIDGEEIVSDARTGKRFPLQLSTTIRGGKTSPKLEGKTADLSAAGVFIYADGDFDIGSNVEFDITLPAKVIGAERDVEIRCQGRVVRSIAARRGREKKNPGVACVIDNYKFVRKS
jgi:hypothetical protein